MKRVARLVCVLGVAAGLCGCAVGGFDLTNSSSSPPPPSSPAAEPAGVPGSIVPPPQHAAAPPPHGQPVQTQPAVQAAAPPPQQATQTRRVLPAARAARAPDIPSAPPPDAEPEMTVYRARELCWMSTEANKATRTVDQKVQFVQKCVDEKLRAAAR
jgi:hypothetical protein